LGERDGGFVRARRQGAGNVVGVDDRAVEPDFQAVVAAHFEQGLLLFVAVDGCAKVRNALFAAEELEQVEDIRASLVYAGGHRLPLDILGVRFFWGKRDVEELLIVFASLHIRPGDLPGGNVVLEAFNELQNVLGLLTQ